jgi:hypothetical protein
VSRVRPAALVPPSLLVLLAACAGLPSDTPACTGPVERWALPDEISEASGLAPSGRHAGLVWTHNDGREAVLYALELPPGGGEARIRARVRVDTWMYDLEDLELSRCDEGWCLWLADTGDNAEHRGDIVVIRVPEPALTDTVVAAADAEWRRLRFPDRPRDVEALAVLPGERIHLLSKGRSGPPTWYRVPSGAPASGDSAATLELIGETAAGPPSLTGQATGASHVPGTENRVLVRSYRGLGLHEIGPTSAHVVGPDRSLAHLNEPQGEGVAALADGTVLLVSEAGPFGGRGGIVALTCEPEASRE